MISSKSVWVTDFCGRYMKYTSKNETQVGYTGEADILLYTLSGIQYADELVSGVLRQRSPQ